MKGLFKNNDYIRVVVIVNIIMNDRRAPTYSNMHSKLTFLDQVLTKIQLYNTNIVVDPNRSYTCSVIHLNSKLVFMSKEDESY